MSWKREVDGIGERRRRALEEGGPEAVQKHHDKGRLTVRERIGRMVDDGSFREEGPIAGHSETNDAGELVSFTPANYVLGFAKIDERPVVVGGEDFTQRGGSPSPAGLRKSVFAEQLALSYRVPLVRFLEGAGGSVPRPDKAGGPPKPSYDPVFGEPRFLSIMSVMAAVPVVSAALGPVAGFPAARLVASHFSVMTRDTAQVLIAGPAVVERALGGKHTKDSLGGAAVHAKSGVVDNVANDEAHAFELMRRFLSYLPTNVWQPAPVAPSDDDPARADEALLEIVPRERRKTYKMRAVLEAVVDRGSLFELSPQYGRTQITALARLDGKPVGVVANDPRFYAGAMTADASQKFRRFVDLCDTFHLPIVSFVDEPGFMIGPDAEKAATIRYGGQALFAAMQSTVPWCSVIVRKVYGVAGAAHFGPNGHVLAWPSAETGALPIEGGVAVAFRRQLQEADDPEALRTQLEDTLAAQRSPYARAEAFGVNDLIDPRETRPALCDWIERVQAILAEHQGPRAYTVRP